MANPEHLALLKQGVEAWNEWRKANPDIRPNLLGADLIRADLRGANLSKATLVATHLSMVNLGGADFRAAEIWKANLEMANLQGANLEMANLQGANLSWADLRGANLEYAILVGTNLTGADLTDCRVYGISAWDLRLEGARQNNLVITRFTPELIADDIELCQIIHLLIYSKKLRNIIDMITSKVVLSNIIDMITSKVVLILGRFTPERKAVLDTLREELRKRNYQPILFDFDKPVSRDITETVSLLAHMAKFVIADLTAARSIPQELMVIAPNLPSVPIQPLLQEGTEEYGMFEHFRRYPWVLKEYVYASPQQLIANLSERVIGPAEAKVCELRDLKPALERKPETS